jgi:xylulokinase
MILAVDIGSSRVKGGLFSGLGECLGAASVELPPPGRGGPLEAEVDPGPWMEALARISSRLLAGEARPDALVISGNGPTVLPVDASGAPLHRALTWADRRAVAEARDAGTASGSGPAGIAPGFALPKALWFARHEEGIYERTAAFLGCPEYLAMVLTGRLVAVVPEGYEAYYGEAPALAALGLDAGKFPERVRPGSLVGATSASGEAASGIPAGTPLVLAGPDYLAAILGTAATRPGRACDRAGTSEGINLCTEKPIAAPRLISVPHIAKPYANLSGSITSTGRAVEWFLRAGRGRASPADYESFFAEAGAAAPGADGIVFLPYLAGERAPINDPAAKGAFIGLSAGQGRPELERAVLEATALAIRDVLRAMEEAGASASELRVCGKPASSALWNQIKADVTGKPVLAPAQPEAELLGDACFGLAALGEYKDLAEAAETLVRTGSRFEPDASRRGLYDELFGRYKAVYRALSGLGSD